MPHVTGARVKVHTRNQTENPEHHRAYELRSALLVSQKDVDPKSKLE